MSRNGKVNDQLSWGVAPEYVAELGDLPSFFPAAVRLLLSDHQRNTGQLRPATKLLVSYAMRGNKMLSMLYHASKDLKPGTLDCKRIVKLGDLINLFPPYDLAILYTTFLLYRKCRKLYEDDLDKFYRITARFSAESQFGGFVGVAIPAIGIGNATLSGCLHHLALSLLALDQNNQIEEYLEYLKEKNLFWDFDYEMSKFGCNSLQIGCLLLTKMGFSSSYVDLYWRSLDPVMRNHLSSGPNQSSMLFGRLWIEGLVKDQAQPVDAVPGDYYPTEEMQKWLKKQIESLKGGSKSWFNRDGTDISPEKTPQLFAESQKDQDIPEQLRNIFSLKELSTMKQDDFDELIDQIDKKILDGTFDREPPLEA